MLWDALDLIAPLPRNLHRGFDRLRAGVHRQDHVVAEELGDILGEPRKDIVVECSRAEGQPLGLLRQGLDQLRMTMALIDGRIGGEEVQIPFPLRIPHRSATCPCKNHGQGMIVVSGVDSFVVDGLLRG